VNVRPVETEFHADGYTDRHTDMTKLIVVFRNFARVFENYGLRTGSIPVLGLKARLMPAYLGPVIYSCLWAG
jgi:hypothetical protein